MTVRRIDVATPTTVECWQGEEYDFVVAESGELTIRDEDGNEIVAYNRLHWQRVEVKS